MSAPNIMTTTPNKTATSDAWQWWASRDKETYTVGPEDSREAVIQEAAALFDGEGFWIIEAIQGQVDGLMPEGRRIIEDALERAADDGVFGDDGDYDLGGKPEVQREAYSELNAALSSWFEKWKQLFPRPWAFDSTRNAEFVPTSSPAVIEGEGSRDGQND